jgi:hypothetical protein
MFHHWIYWIENIGLSIVVESGNGSTCTEPSASVRGDGFIEDAVLVHLDEMDLWVVSIVETVFTEVIQWGEERIDGTWCHFAFEENAAKDVPAEFTSCWCETRDSVFFEVVNFHCWQSVEEMSF